VSKKQALEDTMNAYMTDQIAREHADRLMADGAAARRLRRVRQSQRAASTVTRVHPTAGPAPVPFVRHPVAAFWSWLAAGLL
jgi:2-methylcitrate dehydratase PrpD